MGFSIAGSWWHGSLTAEHGWEDGAVHRSWFRMLAALSVLLAFVAVVLFLSPSGWLVEDSSPTRNWVEALGWLAAIGTAVGGIASAAWRRISRVGHSSAPVSENSNPGGVFAGHALHLVDEHPPKVSEVALLDLGVQPAIDTDSDADLPPFIPRDSDDDLEWAITQGGMVLLHGRAASGKSRAAVEALRRLRPNHDLIVPCDGSALRQLAEAGVDFTETVVWLDNLERFLTPGGLDLGLLTRLCPRGSRTAVVATMRDEELAHYDYVATADSDEFRGLARNGVELIRKLRNGRRIRLDSHLTDAERGRAAKKDDHRIHSALSAEEGFGEYLAAGRALLGCWSTGDGDLFHVGQAIVSVAVDCRRAGYHQAVPAASLEALHYHYLAPGWRHRSDLPGAREGIAWASRRVLGASSCIQPRAAGTYLASDYLVDRAEAPSSPLKGAAVPTATWRIALQLATPDEAVDIGHAANEANAVDVAEEAFRLAADAGNLLGMRNLGMFLEERCDASTAETWLRKAVDAGDSVSLFVLGLVFKRRGDLSEAETWFRRAVDADDDGSSMRFLGLILQEQGKDDEAENWFLEAILAGDIPAMRWLASLLEERGDLSEAETWWRAAVDAGDDSAGSLGLLLQRRNNWTEAEFWLRKAIDAGDSVSLVSLGLLFYEQGNEREAETWFRRAADTGDSDLMALVEDEGLLSEE